MTRALRRAGAVASLLALATVAAPAGPASAASPSTAAGRDQVVARGLDNPRGIAFGPDGALYVAEAGRGGAGPCTTVELFGGPMCFGPSGAVTRVQHGQQRRVSTGLGSMAHADGGFAFGAHDISFRGGGGAYVTVGGCFGLATPAQGNCGGLFRLGPHGEPH